MAVNFRACIKPFAILINFSRSFSILAINFNCVCFIETNVCFFSLSVSRVDSKLRFPFTQHKQKWERKTLAGACSAFTRYLFDYFRVVFLFLNLFLFSSIVGFEIIVVLFSVSLSLTLALSLSGCCWFLSLKYACILSEREPSWNSFGIF